jgi:exosortase A-associated hydrolase 2
VSAPAPVRPFFLPVGSREIFCLHHAPAGAARGAVVNVPAFAEEMTKSRRLVALQARALAAAGFHVLRADLCGCGDSERDFGDANWSAWLDDVSAARRWLARQSGIEPWLWGLRLGALLACASLERQPADGIGLVLWQPVLSGRQHLQQFLRLQAGAQWVGGARAEAEQARPLDRLRAGEAVEVAGYTLAPALALPMAEAELRLPARLRRIGWFEVSPHEDAALSAAAERALAATRDATDVRAAVVRGPSFWQAQEIETAPALLVATTAAFAP